MIGESGWIDHSRDEGYWASDQLLDDDSSWTIKVPQGLKAGEYVRRTEIIVRAPWLNATIYHIRTNLNQALPPRGSQRYLLPSWRDILSFMH